MYRKTGTQNTPYWPPSRQDQVVASRIQDLVNFLILIEVIIIFIMWMLDRKLKK